MCWFELKAMYNYYNGVQSEGEPQETHTALGWGMGRAEMLCITMASGEPYFPWRGAVQLPQTKGTKGVYVTLRMHPDPWHIQECSSLHHWVTLALTKDGSQEKVEQYKETANVAHCGRSRMGGHVGSPRSTLKTKGRQPWGATLWFGKGVVSEESWGRIAMM